MRHIDSPRQLRLIIETEDDDDRAREESSFARPSRGVRLVAWLVAAWCLGFAAVNLGYEVSGRFDAGPYAEYADGLALMSWLVLLLKVAGAAAAVLAVRPVPRGLPAAALDVTLWGATALLTLYSVGNLVQLAGMLSGTMGSRDDVTPLGLAYVGFFVVGAAGYAVIARSFSRRHRMGWRTKVLGAVGAPVFLGLLLVGIPAVLAHWGLLPD